VSVGRSIDRREVTVKGNGSAHICTMQTRGHLETDSDMRSYARHSPIPLHAAATLRRAVQRGATDEMLLSLTLFGEACLRDTRAAEDEQMSWTEAMYKPHMIRMWRASSQELESLSEDLSLKQHKTDSRRSDPVACPEQDDDIFVVDLDCTNAYSMDCRAASCKKQEEDECGLVMSQIVSGLRKLNLDEMCVVESLIRHTQWRHLRDSK
jgi:hypothetical protein